jgi:hypothetical protein
MIEGARAIALVKAVAAPGARSGCALEPVRFLKGDGSSGLQFSCRLPMSDDWMTNFKWHQDTSFWSTGRLGVASDCTVIPPAFEVGHMYLLFLGIEPDLKEAEEVRASDRWLKFVEEHSVSRK